MSNSTCGQQRIERWAGGLTLLLAVLGCAEQDKTVSLQNTPSARQVTFNKHVAPIIFEQCTTCHRPGESAPFPLLSYQQVRKHAGQIADVTESRFMPPWLPEQGYNHFQGERYLSDEQISLFRLWAKQGAVEGDPADLPPAPQFTEGWQLGRPDLVIQMTEPYTLAADGIDVYRNFVIPIPVEKLRWVKALELRSGNKRIVHHAFMLFDRTPASRNLDQQEPVTGFDGMDTGPGAQSPDGHFISWQPGKMPSMAPEGMAWRLYPGTDLVLQVHMQPTGKKEKLQAKIGLFFTETPPTRRPMKIILRSTEIDIPAGQKQYIIEDKFELPVGVDVLGVIPHAHYLGKRIEGFATLPDGSIRWLILIKDWDFNWQGDYRFAEPVYLPKGSLLSMRLAYDNSVDNVRNPNHPPKRVTYGLQSTDEMGEFWVQLLPRDAADLKTLQRGFGRKVLDKIAQRSAGVLRDSPNDVKAHIDFGKVAWALGRSSEAMRHFRAAVRFGPSSAAAHYNLGHVLLRGRQHEQAKVHLEAAIALDSKYFSAHHDLGMLYLMKKELNKAARGFQEALRIDPYHATAHNNLGRVLLEQGKPADALEHFEKALLSNPDSVSARANRLKAKAMLNKNGK